jgi:hypothetical protein
MKTIALFTVCAAFGAAIGSLIWYDDPNWSWWAGWVPYWIGK